MRLATPSLVVVAALAGCGGGAAGADGSIQRDAGNTDADNVPAPPALGAQLDRMGRPAIRTMLIAAYEGSAVQTARRDAYDRASDPASWPTTTLQTNLTIAREIANNLAVFDAFDTGMTTIPGAGCGNALSYVLPSNAASYGTAAGLFADDQLYVDTEKAACEIYFDLEIEHATGLSIVHSSCGGRTLRHDVVDATYSVLAAGSAGLNAANKLAPKIFDGVGPHGDISDTFPFLGPPH